MTAIRSAHAAVVVSLLIHCIAGAEQSSVALVGKPGAPIVEIDKKTGTAREVPKPVLRINAAGAGIQRAEKNRVAVKNAIAASNAQERADAKAKEKAAKETQAKEAKAKDAETKEAREKLDTEAAELKMRAAGWEDQTPDGEVLFNPNTMSFQMREDVVKDFKPGAKPENPVVPGTPARLEEINPPSTIAEPAPIAPPAIPEPPPAPTFPEPQLKPPL